MAVSSLPDARLLHSLLLPSSSLSWGGPKCPKPLRCSLPSAKETRTIPFLAGYALVNKTQKVTPHCCEGTQGISIYLKIHQDARNASLFHSQTPTCWNYPLPVPDCDSGFISANTPQKFTFESSAPRAPQSHPLLRPRDFSPVPVKIVEASVTGEEMGIKTPSWIQAHCAAVAGQGVAISSDVPAKLKSVIASYLSSVKIFVVSLSAGEGDDAAGGEEIGRWQRDCSCLGDRKLQARKTPTSASEIWESQNRHLQVLLFPTWEFWRGFSKAHMGDAAQSHWLFYFFFWRAHNSLGHLWKRELIKLGLLGNWGEWKAVVGRWMCC